MDPNNPSRRGMLAAVAAAPIALAAPAAASMTEPNRHAVWLAEREELMRLANHPLSSEEETDRYCDLANDVEDLAMDTPATTQEAALSQIEMIAVMARDRLIRSADDTHATLISALAVLRSGGQS